MLNNALISKQDFPLIGLSMDGVNNMAVGSNATLQFIDSGDDFSFSCTFKRVLENKEIFWSFRRLGIAVFSTGFLLLGADNGTAYDWLILTNLQISSNVNYCLVVTHQRNDPTQGVKIWLKNIDTGIIQTRTYGGFVNTVGSIASNFYLGYRASNPYGYMQGTIYDIAFYNSLLTQNEALRITKYLTPPKTPTAHFRLENVYKTGANYFTTGTPSDLQLFGFATGNKCIVDKNNNDIQLTP
jgi:hypothetical protein